MILYVNADNEINDVDTTDDSSLIPVYVDENNEDFPFKGWSTAKICCYKVTVNEGVIMMMTPYRDSKTLDFIDKIGHDSDNKTEALKILFGEEE